MGAWQGQDSRGQRGCVSWLEAGAQGFHSECALEECLHMTLKSDSGSVRDPRTGPGLAWSSLLDLSGPRCPPLCGPGLV